MAKDFMSGYKTYDTTNGFGNRKQWRSSFYTRMNQDEEHAIIDHQNATPWDILGVARDATQPQIKAAFRELIMLWHPDRNAHRIELATEMSKLIIAAYTILKK